MSLVAAMAVPAMVVPFTQMAEASAVQFKDISKTSPYYTAVTEMVGQGIIFGYTDGTYKPQAEITRVQVAMLLSRALSLDPVREAKDFKDVPKTYKHYDAIRKVQQAGIIDGGSDGKFNPEAKLTRGQMAKILAIGFNLEVKADFDFPDVPESHWANKYVRALYSNGITVGNNGKFEPSESVTRGQYAMFLHRLMNVDPDFEAKPIPKPEQPKPEKPTPPVVKPEEPVDPPVVTPPTPEKPSGDNGLVTDKYPDLAKVPKPKTYKPGIWEDNNLKKVEGAMGKNELTNIFRFSLENTSKLPDDLAKAVKLANTNEEILLLTINNAVNTGSVFTSGNSSLYYDFQTGEIVMAYKG